MSRTMCATLSVDGRRCVILKGGAFCVVCTELQVHWHQVRLPPVRPVPVFTRIRYLNGAWLFNDRLSRGLRTVLWTLEGRCNRCITIPYTRGEQNRHYLLRIIRRSDGCLWWGASGLAFGWLCAPERRWKRVAVIATCDDTGSLCSLKSIT